MASTEEQVAHVWRRLGFGPSPADMSYGLSIGPQALIEDLTSRALTSSSYWALPAISGWDDPAAYMDRLFELMQTSSNPLQERMAWMMMGLLVVGYSDGGQNEELDTWVRSCRSGCLGSYFSLLSTVASGWPMQWYLSNVFSEKGHANENLARELCELFSLGPEHPVTGQPNYTEEDIKEIARSLTGYDYDWDRDKAFFNPFHWDSGSKTIFGASRGAAKFPEVLAAIQAHPSFGYFVPRRIYRELMGFDPSSQALEDMRVAWGTEGDLKALVHHVATRPEFLSDAAIRCRVKSPMELMIGSLRVLGLKHLSRFYLQWQLYDMRQYPFQAPNVNGWPSGAAWLHASQLVSWSSFLSWACFEDDGTAAIASQDRSPTIRTLKQQGSNATGGDLALQMAGLYDVSTETREAMRDFAAAGRWEHWRACGLMQLALSCPEYLLN